MATFSYTPDFDAQESKRPIVRRVQFADGYEQRLAYGLNTQPSEWRLTFRNRTDTERDDIRNFLIARGATESFDWTPPGGSSGKWVCDEWSTVLVAANINTIQATFRQVFEP
jgi:phage-related protein